MFRAMAIIAAGLAATAPAAAQTASAEGEFSFNLFEFSGVTLSDVYTFDESYTERFGIAVPVPFRLDVPRRDGVGVIADGRPDGGGFVRFTFYTETDAGERVFLENIQVVTATIPLLPEAQDPAEARIGTMIDLVQNIVYPRAVEGFVSPEILALEEIPLGADVPNAVQLIGRYVDPPLGEMLLRIVAMPHPAQAESYVTISNIRLAMVPVNDGETLRQSMTGRVMESWDYLDHP